MVAPKKKKNSQKQAVPARLPARRGRGRPKAMSDEAQSTLIVDGSRELFLKSGYGGTTMDDVAAQCRVSKRTLYRLFPSKTALFAAIVEAHRHSMLALPGSYDDLPLAEALRKIFRVDIDRKSDRDRMALLQLVMLESTQFPELRDILWTYGPERARALLTEWFERLCARGRLQIDDAGTAAGMLMDAMFGPMARRTADDASRLADQKLREYQLRCIRIFLNGVSPR